MSESARPVDSVRWLTALPVYNEEKHVREVLEQVLNYSPEVLVVDDGSKDQTARELAAFPQVKVLTHEQNRGYGAALRSAFDYALEQGYDLVVTIDCDGQHQPERIPEFIRAAIENEADVVSGSRYLMDFPGDSPAPPERRKINHLLTAEINRRLGFQLTDAFCGFKAYKVSSLAKIEITERGYAMPLEFWVQAASLGLKVVETAVPRVYLEEARSFGGALDDGRTRLEYYHLTLDRSIAARQRTAFPIPMELGWQPSPCDGRPCPESI